MSEETAKQTPKEAVNDEKKVSSEAPKYDPKTLNLRSGLTVRVHQKIREKNSKGEMKERIQVFEGRIIAMKHGLEPGATITVRKISESIGVEKIFPIFSPNIDKIEIKKEAKVRRAKLYFLRDYKKRLKEKLLG